MNNKAPIKKILLALGMLLILAFTLFPIPYYVEVPGETMDLKEIITVNNKHDDKKGSFSLTSVGLRRATPLLALKAKLTPFEEIISEDSLKGGTTDEEYEQIQKYYMVSSQNNAIQEALKLAGKPYEMKFEGVYVLGVDEHSNFKKSISMGDTVTKVDGHAFDSSEEFVDYVKSQKVGQDMTVSFVHDGETKETTEKLIRLKTDQKPGIGIVLTDDSKIESPVDVKIDTGKIGGPSAGLMFTLEIYEQISGKDLRKGKDVAGTGTIDSEGNVGRIGGIDKKVASASKSGVEIFFAPDDEIDKEMRKAEPGIKSNYEEAVAAAKKLDTKMKIVPVKNVQDALDYLEKMK